MSSSPKNPQTRVLIVGAYGFLGHHVTNYFVNKDYHVHLAVKSSSKPPKSIIYKMQKSLNYNLTKLSFLKGQIQKYFYTNSFK